MHYNNTVLFFPILFHFFNICVEELDCPDISKKVQKRTTRQKQVKKVVHNVRKVHTQLLSHLFFKLLQFLAIS